MTLQRLTHRVDCTLPTVHGEFGVHLFSETIDHQETKEHIAIVKGDIRHQVNVLVRIHSECFTGDVLGCQRCDCQDQLHTALEMIRRQTRGMLLYLRQEGRGIGLENKLRAYKLQDTGLDTVEANIALGFPADTRDYAIAAEMINYFGIKSIDLITNNTNKVAGVERHGITVNRRVPIVLHSPIRDRKSLFQVKQQKLGHVFDTLTHQSNYNEEENEYPLTHPELFLSDSPLPTATRENSRAVSAALIAKFGDDLLCILLQGSNMRGDGSIQSSDFDYICILKCMPAHTTEHFANIKQAFPQSNFLFITDREYQTYPQDARLQFFITRRVYGSFDLGLPPSRQNLLATATKYAIQLKDAIRPLLLELTTEPTNPHLFNQAHTILKRVDDCFIRVVCLYTHGKYPLHRHQIHDMVQGESIKRITRIIDQWYTEDHQAANICAALRDGDRLIRIFLRRLSRNKL